MHAMEGGREVERFFVFAATKKRWVFCGGFSMWVRGMERDGRGRRCDGVFGLGDRLSSEKMDEREGLCPLQTTR